MRFIRLIVVALVLVSFGCGGGIQIAPSPPVPPVPPVGNTLLAPTQAELTVALGEDNPNGMVPGFGLGDITIPPCTQEDGSPVDFPVTYWINNLPAWLDFDPDSRSLFLDGLTIVPPDARDAIEVMYSCTDDEDPTINDSRTFVINDLDGGGMVDWWEYYYGEVPLVGLTGYFQLNRDDVDVYRPSDNGFLVPTGVVRATVGMDPRNASDDTEDFDGDEGAVGGGNNAEEALADTNIFAHASAATFTGSVNSYGARDDPRSVVSADFDGDGDLDLAVTNFGFSDNVSVFINNGDGSFQNDVPYPTGNDPYGIGAADMDGDGDIDLVTSNNAFSLSLLRGLGNGVFLNHVDTALANRPAGMALADLDGDGDVDAVVGHVSINFISVLLNNGSGGFGPVATYMAGGPADNTEHLTIADFNNDGIMDVATASRVGTDVFVLSGNGDGSFGPYRTYGVQNFPYGVSSADFDGDGNLDLAVANALSNNVSVLLGNGDGTFDPDSTYGTDTIPQGVIASDLDGDGNIDLATANWGGNNTSVLLGRGDGTFEPDSTFATDVNSRFLVSADFDGDGKLDLAVVNSGTDNMTVLLND